MNTPIIRIGSGRRGVALMAALMLLIVAFGLTISMIDQGTADVRSQALRESDVRSYADAMSAANYCMDYLVTNGTVATVPAPATSAGQFIDLAGIAPVSGTSSPFTLTQAHKGINYDLVPSINSSKVAWVRVTSMAATTGYYQVSIDSEGYTVTHTNTVIALGSDVDASMLRGVDAVVSITPRSPVIPPGFQRAVNANSTYSYKASVDWWNSGWTGSNKGSAYAGPIASKDGTALVQAFASIPTPFGNGGSVNSSPEFAKSSTAVPSFTYDSPGNVWGNTSGGTSVAGAMTGTALTGNVTLVAGQSYHFSSISSGPTITIDNGGNAGLSPAPTATVFVDGAMGLSNSLTYTQNNTVLEVLQGDPGSGMSYNGNTAFGSTQYAPGRFIWATSANEEITMNGNGSFGGVLIAPNATLKLNGTFNFYGALMVGAISQISGNFSLAWDSQLANQVYTLGTPVNTQINVLQNMWRTR